MASQVTTREPVKVTLIDTYYIEADPTNFKSIVQSLTGKVSPTLETEGSSPKDTRVSEVSSAVDDGKAAAAAPQDGGIVDSMMMHTEVASGDLETAEWWMLELPEDEELGWLMAD